MKKYSIYIHPAIRTEWIIVTAVMFVQVELACKLGKPLFLHERDAHQQMVDILQKNIERSFK